MAEAALHLPQNLLLRSRSKDNITEANSWFDCDWQCGGRSNSSTLHSNSTGLLVRASGSQLLADQFLGRTSGMNCCGHSNCRGALSLSRGNFLSSISLITVGCRGGPGFDRSFLTFTNCRKEGLHWHQRVGKLGSGYTEQNFQKHRSSISRLCRSANDDQSMDTQEETTDLLEVDDEPLPTMEEIQEVVREQGLKIEIRSLGPWFQINLMSPDEKVILGSAEGFETRWFEGRILHLETIRLTREAPKGKSVLGPGFLVGATAVRYGLDKNCPKAELLAINDDSETHARLVKYYSRMGFKAMYELTGEEWTDIFDRAVWGGVGTRMDANCEELLRKWARFLRPKSKFMNPSKGFSQNQTLEKVQQK